MICVAADPNTNELADIAVAGDVPQGPRRLVGARSLISVWRRCTAGNCGTWFSKFCGLWVSIAPRLRGGSFRFPACVLRLLLALRNR